MYSILLFSLIICLPLMIIDYVSQNKEAFNIPSRFDKVIVDLSEQDRTEELIFESDLNVPSSVELFIQSDASGEKIVKVVSESAILGYKNQEIYFNIGQYTGSASTSATLIIDPGTYSIYLSGEKTEGKIAVGYRVTPKDISEYERLLKIHNGDLMNPPDGYEKVFSTNLSGLVYKGEVIYTLSLTKTTNIGFSIYTSAESGNVSIDLIGESSNYYGMVHPEHNRICDQLETTLPPGEYLFKLTCENADGDLVLFVKQ